MKPEEKPEEEKCKDKKRPKDKGKEKEKSKGKGKDTDKDLKDRIVSFFSFKVKGRDASPAKSANQWTVPAATIDPNSPIESSNERMPPRRESHPEGDSYCGHPPNSPKASDTSSLAHASPSAENSPSESRSKPPSSKPSEASAVHASPSAENSTAQLTPKPLGSTSPDANPVHASPNAENSPSESTSKPPSSKPSEASAVNAFPSSEKSPSELTPKPPSSKPSEASPAHASPNAENSSAESTSKPPSSKPSEASAAHASPSSENSPSEFTPKPPSSKPSEASAAHASPSAENSPAESAPNPSDSKPSDASQEQTSASADNIPAKTTPSADSGLGLSSSGSNQEQTVEQAAHESGSTTTQPAQPSDSPVTPAIATPASAPSPPTSPPEAPEEPAAKTAADPEPIQPSRGGLVGFDESISKKLAIWTSDGWAKSFMKIFVRGTYAVSWLIWMPVLIISTPPSSPLREQLVNLYRGIIWTGIIVLILRVICKRPKPPKLDGSLPSPYSAYTDLYSFPSNSNAMTMLACRFLSVNYGDWTVTLVAAILVILVALAALTLGRHYLFDVIVGWIIGIVIFCVSKRMWIPMDKCDQHVKRILDALHI